MKRVRHATTVAIALLAWAGSAFAAASAAPPATGTPASPSSSQTVPPPAETPQIKQLLKKLQHADTWGHPDQFGEYAGLVRLFDGDYAGALKYLKIGARYADKLSQLTIGMMYYNGRGVARNPATACAWLTLAAERNYPSFVHARDGLCGTLTPAQQQQAAATLQALLPIYGDQVAKKRMALALADARAEMTGSRVGFDFGISMSCGSGGAIGSAMQNAHCSGHNYWAPQNWDPRQYFAARDAYWYATVTVGAPEPVHAATAAGQAPAPAAPPPASKPAPGH